LDANGGRPFADFVQRFDPPQDSLDQTLQFVRRIRIIVERLCAHGVPDVFSISEHGRKVWPLGQTSEQFVQSLLRERLPVYYLNIGHMLQLFAQLNQTSQGLTFGNPQRGVSHSATESNAFVERLSRL